MESNEADCRGLSKSDAPRPSRAGSEIVADSTALLGLPRPRRHDLTNGGPAPKRPLTFARATWCVIADRGRWLVQRH